MTTGEESEDTPLAGNDPDEGVIGNLPVVRWLAGRASRSQYWLMSILFLAICCPLFLVSEKAASILSVILWLVIMLPIGIKRLHDCGNTGLYMLFPIIVSPLSACLNYITFRVDSSPLCWILLVPGGIIGLIVAVYTIGVGFQLVFLRGDKGPNKYGDDPVGKPLLTFIREALAILK